MMRQLIGSAVLDRISYTPSKTTAMALGFAPPGETQTATVDTLVLRILCLSITFHSAAVDTVLLPSTAAILKGAALGGNDTATSDVQHLIIIGASKRWQSANDLQTNSRPGFAHYGEWVACSCIMNFVADLGLRSFCSKVSSTGYFSEPRCSRTRAVPAVLLHSHACTTSGLYNIAASTCWSCRLL